MLPVRSVVEVYEHREVPVGAVEETGCRVVGINLALQDAVVAANVFADHLGKGKVRARHLRAVQRRRGWAVRLIQGAQELAQRHVVADALHADEPFELSRLLKLLLRTPVLRDVSARLIAYGAWPVHPKTKRRENVGSHIATDDGESNHWRSERVL